MTKKLETIKLQNKDYATVPTRIKEFREANPNGLIETNPEKQDDGQFIFKARILKDKSNKDSAEGTGHSYGPVKNTKDFEKLETIAVGRALAVLGYMASGQVASSEEMEDFLDQKEIKRQNAIQKLKDTIDKIKTIEELRKFFKDNKAHGLGKEVDDYMMARSAELKDKKPKK